MALPDWNDLRYFLAVARGGSTLSAAKSLRVSHSTAARRLTALEAALGLVLFERRATGYVLTAAGEALIETAEAMETAAAEVAEVAARQSREASGTVRLTVAEIFAVTLISPILRDLQRAHPAIRIDLDTTGEMRDLAAGEADIALRMTTTPAGGGLVCRRVATSLWTFYASRDYETAHGLPAHYKALKGHVIVGGGDPLPWKLYRSWLRRYGYADDVAMHHGTTTGLLAAVRAGVGIAVLPSIVADLDPELIMCFPSPPEYEIGLWLLTHERLRHTPRVRIVLDFLAERVIALAREAESRRVSASPHWEGSGE
jgi:DNA-binding transcriptional LysR family regulator